MEGIGSIGVLIAIIGLGVLLALLGVIIKSRYKVVPPNEALIIAGTKRKGNGGEADVNDRKVVTSGGVFIWPFIQQSFTVSLEVMNISVDVRYVPTKDKVPITVDSTANVRIGNTLEQINMAAMRFLSWKPETRQENVNQVLAGSLRAIIGKMTVREIIEDRDAFASEVQTIASKELESMGLVIDVMNIREITDDKDYINNLGVQQIEEVRREAEIAKNNARLAITQSTQETEQQEALARKETAIKQSEYDAEIYTQKAIADQAGPLQKAESQKAVVEQETELAGLEATRKERQLVAEVIKPAEANAQKAEIEAMGKKKAAVIEAAGEKEKTELEGQGLAAKEFAIGESNAKVGRLEAEVRGAEIREVAKARAEGLEKEAQALNKLGEASIELKKLEIAPDMIKAAALAFGNIDNIVITGSNGMENFLGLLPTMINQVMDVSSSNGNGHKKVVDIGQVGLEDEGEINILTSNFTDNKGELSKKIADSLNSIEGTDLRTKLEALREKGGVVLETIVGGKTLDEVIKIAKQVNQGSLEDQTLTMLDLIDANNQLKAKFTELVPIIVSLAPKFSAFVKK